VNGFWLTLAAGTVFLLYATWVVSIREKRRHGYPRFFAFESLFILVLLNRDVWFRNPLSPRQILSWIILLASIAFAAAGFFTLRKHGLSRGNFENTTRIVERGIYRFIRHPMYASLLFLGLGAMIKDAGPVTAVLFLVDIVATVITALMDEGEMKAKFGAEYAAYMAKTKRFVPFVL